MCLVSAVGNNWMSKDKWDWPKGYDFPPLKPFTRQGPSKEEFDSLKKQMEHIKLLLEAAKKQDIADGNPDCEMDEKVDVLKKIADALGVDLGDIFK